MEKDKNDLKKVFLENINSKTNEELVDEISKRDVIGATFLEILSKMKPTQLNSLSAEWIKCLNDLIGDGEVSIQELKERGLTDEVALKLKTTREEKSFEPKENTPTLIPDNPERSITAKESALLKLKAGLRSGSADAEEIQRLLNKSIIFESDLEDLGVENSMIQKIKKFRKIDFEAEDVENLPPLRDNASDIYFLGLKGSGKSTMLASLLAYSRRNGLMEPVAGYSYGAKYSRELIIGINGGYLPQSTSTKFVNFIPLDMYFDGNSRAIQKLNFLDMAGELYRKVGEDGIDNFGKYKDYFSTKNRKCLVFVLEYFENPEDKYEEIIKQNFALEQVLLMLEEFGVLENTQSIYLVVTKADLFPSDNPKEYGHEYVKSNYAPFINMLKSRESKYQYGIKLFPYSIGPTSFGYILNEHRTHINTNLETYPKLFLEQLKEDMNVTKRGRWF